MKISKQLSAMFEKQYKLYYDWHCYTARDIARFVKLGTIDAAAYKRITGEDFERRSSEDTSEA